MKSSNTGPISRHPIQPGDASTPEDTARAAPAVENKPLTLARTEPAPRQQQLLALGQAPEDALENLADFLPLADRASLSATSSTIHRAVTQGAAEPSLDAVYRAQAEVRRLDKAGASAQEIDRAKSVVRLATGSSLRQRALQRQADELAAKWNQSLSVEPPDVDLSFRVANLLIQLGRFASAEEVLTHVLRPDVEFDSDDRASLFLQRAKAQHCSGKAAEALLSARTALREQDAQQSRRILAVDLLVEIHLLAGELVRASEWSRVEVSGAWGIHAAPFELLGRQAEENGDAPGAANLRRESQRRLGLARQQGQYDSIVRFYALVGDHKAALLAASQYTVAPPAHDPMFRKSVAAIEGSAEWTRYMQANFGSPDQLARIRFNIDMP